jgi:Leucine-rich repeat (LRR) protein
VLYLANIQVSDLGPLRNCAGLRVLYLANTQVSDLAPLQACTWLERLYLDDTKVSAAEVRRFREARRRAGLGEVEIFGVS